MVCFNAMAAPAPVAPSVAAPGAGPGSGLWSGNTPSEGTSTPPTPAPAPPATCVDADLVGDCFIGVTPGTIDSNNPDLNGWQFTSPFGGKGGSITFSEGLATFQDGSGNTPAMWKTMAQTISTIRDMTLQYRFTEYQVPADRYEAYITSNLLDEFFILTLTTSGIVLVEIGPTASLEQFQGTWTPNGGVHDVHVTIDASQVARVWIDGVEISLTDMGPVSSPAGTFAGNKLLIDSVGPGGADSLLHRAFLTTGVLPPTTEFCCPGA